MQPVDFRMVFWFHLLFNNWMLTITETKLWLRLNPFGGKKVFERFSRTFSGCWNLYWRNWLLSFKSLTGLDPLSCRHGRYQLMTKNLSFLAKKHNYKLFSNKVFQNLSTMKLRIYIYQQWSTTSSYTFSPKLLVEWITCGQSFTWLYFKHTTE